KRIIETGSLGRPVAVAWNEGRKFAWPTKSGFYFTQRPQNNLPPPGILLDVGAHVVDLLCWWFGSDPVVVECQTDSFGGPEARATLALDFAGVMATAEFSYYQKLTNKYRIQFELGCITGVSGEEHWIKVSRADKEPVIVRLPHGRISVRGHATQMIANFAGAVAGTNPPLVTGADVLPSIKVIAQAYRQARGYDACWLPRFGD
ncbi:MAG: hypothetical protein JO122_00245, partial [Acetobacteraceae bacterium]|nr:hypothetical protein [Acetobacteraceae bacterium]